VRVHLQAVSMPTLEAIGTAVPANKFPQSALKAKAEEVVSAVAPALLQYLDVFDSTGIKGRYLVRDLDWYVGNHGWKERSEIYKQEGLALIERAARQALENADLRPKDIGGIVFVSTTGISTPSLDARLLNTMGFSNSIQRVPLWGLGCAGGVAGLSLAGDLARAHPDRRYLLLSLELCSLAFHLGDLDIRAFVAATLFGDGAAAAIVRGDEIDGASFGNLHRGSSHEWNDSENVMGWNVLDEGLSVVFSRKIPEIVERELAPVVARYAGNNGTRPDRYVFHPGGTKVLQAYEKALGLGPNALDCAKTVLEDYGNMSSPTVLFALRESLRRPLKEQERALMAALGPGFASELLLLEG
jgi:alkylresorcinol/alkylpyrone synthase